MFELKPCAFYYVVCILVCILVGILYIFPFLNDVFSNKSSTESPQYLRVTFLGGTKISGKYCGQNKNIAPIRGYDGWNYLLETVDGRKIEFTNKYIVFIEVIKKEEMVKATNCLFDNKNTNP